MFRYGLLMMIFFSGLYAFGNDLAERNRNSILALQRMVMEQNERIDGLTSLLEGMSASLAELKEQQRHMEGRSDPQTVKLIKDLGRMIDEINRNYVSKEMLQKMLSKQGVPQNRTVDQHTAQPVSHEIEKTSPAKLYSEGVRLFVKKRYAEAEKRFTVTAQKGYKPAASNYYLGEIAYYTKHYDDAVFYYKKSAGLYDKASYMDVLLLHTAIALDKTGKKEQARLFYENVIENYPQNKSAQIARSRLKRL
jgi:TolA-binding protein